MVSKFTSLLLLAFCVFAASASRQLIQPDFKVGSPKIVSHLVRQLLSQTDVTPYVSEREQSCFNEMKEKEAEVNTQYNNAWVLCTQAAQDAKSAITKELEKSRNDLIGQGQTICSALTDCESNSDGLKFLSCTSEISYAKYPQLLKMSVNSTSLVNSIRSKYAQIDSAESECTNLAFYKFYTDFSEIVNERQECLKKASGSNSP